MGFSPAEPEVSGSLRDGTDRALSEAGGDLTARSPPVSPHYSHITPHCGCTCTLLTAVCLRQGATRRELRGRTQTGLVHIHAPSRRTRRGELAFCPHVPRAPARPRGSHRLSRRRAGRHSVRTGRKRQKRGSASMLCTVAGWVCGEPDCMRVPSQGPHGGGAVRCYTGNGPMRHAFCTRVRCGVRELRAGVDPIKIR